MEATIIGMLAIIVVLLGVLIGILWSMNSTLGSILGTLHARSIVDTTSNYKKYH